MLANLTQLRKTIAKQGLKLPGDEDDDDDRDRQIRTAYQDYNADSASDSGASDQSDTSTKPSRDSSGKRRKREGGRVAVAPQKKQCAPKEPSGNHERENEEDFRCNLCDGGFALGKLETMTPLELLWTESLHTQPTNASFAVFVKEALRFYRERIRPASIADQGDYGEMTYKDMREHLVHHVKTLALERLYQVERCREKYMKADDDDSDPKASDRCLKFMNHSYKLLKDKDREERAAKQLAQSTGN